MKAGDERVCMRSNNQHGTPRGVRMNNFKALRACVWLLCLPAFVCACAGAAPARALATALARTPPMGWNSWNKFGCNVSEKLIREMADAVVSSGMKDAGYTYVVIDDCWQTGRDAEGNITPDPQRFPSGMKALADYVHSKGLKFGLYSDAGTLTCQKRPGSRGYEFQDARQYAAWGVDYLKYDWCSTGTQNQPASYSIMRDALLKSGRAIVFSICEWGTSKPWTWARDVGNLWRTTSDIQDCWDCRRDWGGMGFVHILDLQDGLEAYAGPGHWNDPDMLEVGNGGMTPTEYRAHFSLWCILAAPLMAGNDLRQMSPDIAEILTNKELIAVDQDPLGLQARGARPGAAASSGASRRPKPVSSRKTKVMTRRIAFAFLVALAPLVAPGFTARARVAVSPSSHSAEQGARVEDGPARVAFERAARLRRGVNLSHWFAQSPGGDYSEKHLLTHTAERNIATIKSLGFDHVRFTFEPSPLFDEARPSDLNPDYLRRLDAALDMLLASGLSVVFDVHPSDEFKIKLRTDDRHVEAFAEFWRALAAHLSARDPERLFLEILNEPMVEDAYRWMGIQARVAARIRESAPRHTIIAAGARWSSVEELLRIEPLADPNVIYNFHLYDPHTFTHQGATWGAPFWPSLKT